MTHGTLLHLKPISSQRVIAVDGHDGSGKTTLARDLATRCGGIHVRPFAGAVGRKFLAAAESGKADEAIAIAQASISDIVKREAAARLIVFDRCWMTVFSAVPDGHFDRWRDRVPTLLCWSDLATTLTRLRQRNEAQPALEWHEYYLQRYAALAERFGCCVLRTDQLNESAALDNAEKWLLSITT